MADQENEFSLHARNWTALAEQSPFWAILSQPGAEEAEFDADEFFRYGREFGDWLARYFDELKILPQTQRALDFGCGLGRLTQMLPRWFDEVHGVDIAMPMIEGARRYNQHGERCKYHHNEALDLQLFDDDSFDFILTVLVLQHMRPQFMVAYLREFMRILRPGGLAFFQLPVCTIIPNVAATGVEVAPEAAARRYDIRLQIRPQNLTSQTHVIRDVQVVVHNDADAPLLPVEVHGRFVDPETGNELPATRTIAATAAGVAPHDSQIVVLPVQSPTGEGHFHFEVTATCTDPWIELQSTCQPAPVHVSEFIVAESDADPKTAWRATEIGEKTTTIGTMDVFDLSMDEVIAVIQECGGEIVRAEEDDWSGPHHVSCHFTVRKL